jgi:hypothetical protein
MESVKRFEQTDFADAAEMIAFAQMGPIPENFGSRAGEDGLDKMFYSMALASVGITSGEEYRKAMNLFRRDIKL